MSALISSKPLPISDIEECIPQSGIGNSQYTGIGKPSATIPRMQTIEEEDSNHAEPDASSCSRSSSTSSVHSQEPKNKVPKEVLEYVEKIREALQAQSERASRQRLTEQKADVQINNKPSPAAGRKRAAPLNILTEKAKNGLIKLTTSRKRVSTFISVKPKAKAGVDNAEVERKGSAFIGTNKIGKVQYTHEDKTKRPVSCHAICESSLGRDGEASPASPIVGNDKDDETYLLNKEGTPSMKSGTKYDLLTGRKLENSTPEERLRQLVILAHRAAVNGIETAKEHVSNAAKQRRRKSGRWSKVD